MENIISGGLFWFVFIMNAIQAIFFISLVVAAKRILVNNRKESEQIKHLFGQLDNVMKYIAEKIEEEERKLASTQTN